MKTILLVGLSFIALCWAQIPANGVSPCDLLYLRKDCMDFVCGSYSLQSSFEGYVTIPQSTSRSPDAPPPDANTIITWTVKNLYGTYSANIYNATDVHLYVDGTAQSLGLGIQLRYDWTGDGVWDRTENLHSFATDVQFGTYQDTNLLAAGKNLFSTTGATYQNMVKGSIEIKLWSAYLVNGTLSAATDRRSYIRIPYISSYSSNNLATAACNIPTTQATQAPKVAFLLNTVQDYYLADAAMAIMDAFNTTPLTVGIIGGIFGEQASLRGKIGAALADTKRKLEIACNGYDSALDMDSATLQQQVDQLSKCVTKFDTSLNTGVTTYVPMASSVKSVALRKAAQLAGYTAISIPSYLDPPPYARQNSDVYRWNSAAATFGDWEVPVNASITFSQIQAQIATDGFAVVNMNCEEFTIGVNNDGGVDYAQIQQLLALISLVKNANYTIVTISDMSADVKNVTTIVEDTSCNCVAFRLDDVQDYYLAPAQRAVISTFQSKGAPLTIGIIGNVFGNAPLDEPNNMVTYLQSAMTNSSASSCFKLEIAHHGWLHEDFSLMTLAQQTTALNNGKNKVSQKLGVITTTFLPPFNLINSDTLKALNATGFATLTSQTDIDLPPYTYTNPKWGLYRFPVGASTSAYKSSDYFIGVPAEVTYQQIKDQIAQYGWSNVMMHPQEYTYRYSNLTYGDVVLPEQISELSRLIDMLRADGIRLTNVNSIQNWFGKANVTDPCLTGRIAPATSTSSSTSAPTTATSASTTATSASTTATSATTSATSETTSASTTATSASTSATSESTSATSASTSATLTSTSSSTSATLSSTSAPLTSTSSSTSAPATSTSSSTSAPLTSTSTSAPLTSTSSSTSASTSTSSSALSSSSSSSSSEQQPTDSVEVESSSMVLFISSAIMIAMIL
eukprot:TRINITY_DN125_c0_g1_i2.p1 TRINITY_DN125_c0_g1~~TRINITY_DN125_c0_g1_i2.p1  ORF type:complete len:922 (-),score=233.70 TRINITY_DN125_c0_g1_i2:85-2808(-)